MFIMDHEGVLPSQSDLIEVEPIYGVASVPASREGLAVLVEAPLLAACLELYDKNIRTIISSANVSDVSRGYAYINIDCNTLSEKNRHIANALGIETFVIPLPDGSELEVGGIKFPVTFSTTVEELSESALVMARQFAEQPMLWAPHYSVEHLQALNPQMEVEELIKAMLSDGYFFEPNERTFYLSEEHYHKVRGLVA
jgi:hypothetical protein